MKKNKSKKKIIVIGCGFGGLQFIKHLKKNRFDILLIDKVNHHQFQPLFYQVAASQIEPATISFPLRRICKRKGEGSRNTHWHICLRLSDYCNWCKNKLFQQ